ncbi:hypothetical protein B7494_g20 [Chlorociboria aeruginascens]|nr:hypothetical protein B7494_g20 [Chlorociboria aeruginascens]
MSADDQTFLDTLSTVPLHAKQASSDILDYVDRHLDKATSVLRDALSSSWVPEYVRPPPPPAPRRVPNVSAPASTYAKLRDWAFDHKILSTVLILGIGGATYYVVRSKMGRKKRRAHRASNGARLEVVVIAGSPAEPVTRSIALDLERRGFIVYVVCNTIEEEVLVQNESRPDIKPLMVDIVDSSNARASIERFTSYLQTPHAAFQGARLHHLIFRSLILIPSLTYPSSPIATLSPSILSDLLNTRLLNPILTTQTFLPLLTTLPISHPQHSSPAPPAPKPSILILTPSIIPSLSPAFHAPESLINHALTSFSLVLAAELSPLRIPITHLQLGTFDFSSFTPKTHLQTLQSQRAETLKWEGSARQAFARNFVASTANGAGGIRHIGTSLEKGSNLRELNDAVFDAMLSKTGGVVRAGMGSSIYGLVGGWAPRGLVAWMMGIRRVEVGGDEEFGKGFASGSGSEIVSRSTSPASRNMKGLGDSEYISVYGDGE